eukprot:5433425-Alexandrium_andersonii.AAC.1
MDTCFRRSEFGLRGPSIAADSVPEAPNGVCSAPPFMQIPSLLRNRGIANSNPQTSSPQHAQSL